MQPETFTLHETAVATGKRRRQFLRDEESRAICEVFTPDRLNQPRPGSTGERGFSLARETTRTRHDGVREMKWQNEESRVAGRISRRRFGAAAFVSSLVLPRWAVAGADEPAVEEHPLVPALRHARLCLEKAEALGGYECVFSKKEVVGNETISQTLKMKVREKPFSVYMYFQEPNEGREVIYVEGKNDNKLLVHETGLASLVGTLQFEPTSSRVMAENRYPITKAGMANMVRTVIDQWELESKYAETDVKYFDDATIGDVTCRVIESSHPQPRKQFPFHITRLWIEEKTQLAVRVQQLGFPKKKDAKPPVIEDYTFTQIKPEVRLTDRDFDPDNPSYNY